MGGRTGRGMARGNAPFLERGCSESAGGVSQKKSRREPYIVRDDLKVVTYSDTKCTPHRPFV